MFLIVGVVSRCGDRPAIHFHRPQFCKPPFVTICDASFALPGPFGTPFAWSQPQNEAHFKGKICQTGKTSLVEEREWTARRPDPSVIQAHLPSFSAPPQFPAHTTFPPDSALYRALAAGQSYPALLLFSPAFCQRIQYGTAPALHHACAILRQLCPWRTPYGSTGAVMSRRRRPYTGKF